MAFQEVTTKAIKLHDEQYKNKPLTGYYLGSKPSTKYQNSKIHRFQLKKDGKIVSVYGAGQLNYLLNEIEPGVLTRVTFTGTVRIDTQYGKNKEVNQFKVEADYDEVLETSKLTAARANADEMVEEEEDTFTSQPAPKKGEVEEDLPF